MTARALVLPAPDARGEIKRWGLAAAIVCAAHAGLMASYLLMPQAEPEGSATSPVVILDFAPLPVAPSSQQDLAPGPEMVEAQPTPNPPEQAEPEVVEPTPLMEAPAEVMLPKPELKAEEKTEQEPDKQKAETQPVQENTPAPQTTAMPHSEQETAVAPKAPSPGSDALRAKMASWRDLVRVRLQQSKRYPASAAARGQTGTVMLSFTVDRSGHVLDRRIVRSSGVAALDHEALAMIERAQPLPAFPPAMPEPSISLSVPVNFSTP